MKYIILIDDGYGDGWELYWFGTNKSRAKKQYNVACKEHRYVQLQQVEILEEHSDWDYE